MFLTIFLRVLLLPLYLINLCIPKNKTIWIFGSWKGETYNDNSKYLYEYVYKKTDSPIRAIWLTKKKSIIEQLKKEGKECYYFYSLPGMCYSIIAGVAVVSRTWFDLPFTTLLFPQRTLYVQLWHGTPLKKLDKLLRGSLFSQILKIIFRVYSGRDYDLVISATEKNVFIYQDIFSISKKNIKILGQPRNDALFSQKKEIMVPARKKKKIILYMPTWRSYPYNYFDKKFGFDLKKLESFLYKENCLLVVKLHFHDQEKYKKQFSSKYIIFINDIDDIYPYLSSVDILLTDYSSIFYDFLLVKKPIIFLPFDIARYTKDVGEFYHGYEKVTPGYKAKNWDEVIGEIKNIFKGKDRYKRKRGEINDMFNPFKDGKNSERVYQEIMTSLQARQARKSTRKA